MIHRRIGQLFVLSVLLLALAPHASYAIYATGPAVADLRTLPGRPTDHLATVDVIADQSVDAERGSMAAVCYALTLGHTGNGSDPVAFPINSPGCPTGEYALGEDISLSGASPALGWGISGWTGTANDSSTASTNALVMPNDDHAVSVHYLRLLGDVNGDGLADSTDALITLSADVGMNTAAFCPMNYGDVNTDGFVDSTDALIILSYDVGMTVPFPVGQPAVLPTLLSQPPGCAPG